MQQISQISTNLREKKRNKAWFFKPQIIVFILLFFSMWYCQYPYENDELEAGKKIPVVVGYLDNWDGPHEVSLHYAKPYNAAKAEPISGATVYITDGQGNNYQLHEEDEGKGKYITEKGKLTGAIGETYQLTILMPDGQRILSEPTIMPPAIEIDTGFLQEGYKWTEIESDVLGTPIVVPKIGTGVFAMVKNIPQGVAYYRVSCISITENVTRTLDTLFYFYRSDSLRLGFEIWDHHHWYRVHKPFEPLHIGRLFASENYTREELTINAFRTQQLFPDGLAGKGEIYMLAWILPFRIHAISPDIYQFYENQIAQLDAPERIYEPIPSQLAGNLYIEGDRDQPVLGVFETSSVGRMNMAVEFLVWRTRHRLPMPRMLSDTISLPRKASYKYGGQMSEIFYPPDNVN